MSISWMHFAEVRETHLENMKTNSVSHELATAGLDDASHNDRTTFSMGCGPIVFPRVPSNTKLGGPGAYSPMGGHSGSSVETWLCGSAATRPSSRP